MNNQGLMFQHIRFGIGQDPPPPLGIDPHEVHVWGFVLDIDESQLIHAVTVLSNDEQERANRLLSDRHRRQRIAAHACLRLLLSRYSGRPPAELVIDKASGGKPFLQDRPSVRYNLTHSHGRALVAIAKDREVGIDLEKVRQDVDVVRLAQRFLSAKDQLFIEQGEPVCLHERFLKAWVAREAVFKAAGTGLTFPLSDDHLELTDDGTAGRLILGRSGKAKPVRFLALEPGWIGALSSEGNSWTITYPRWAESEEISQET